MATEFGIKLKPVSLLAGAVFASLLTACAVSPETQAMIDEYERTIPSCSSQLDCETKWATARTWALQNSDFPIYTESATRIRASSNQNTASGVGIVITREGNGSNDRFLVDVECFIAYGCSEIWESKLDFNRTLNGS